MVRIFFINLLKKFVLTPYFLDFFKGLPVLKKTMVVASITSWYVFFPNLNPRSAVLFWVTSAVLITAYGPSTPSFALFVLTSVCFSLRK